ncbi:MAG: hypothetical protein LBS58_01910 [Coriobacteriales bacterium]|jgi:hypothetical protein|nr:hypothetical protein [Coriobacteriales bacterium]
MMTGCIDNEQSKRVENTILCLQCAGRCCKQSPGRYSPADFAPFGGFSYKTASEFLDQGKALVSLGLIGAFNSKVAPIFMVMHRGEDTDSVSLFCDDTSCTDLTPTGCRLTLFERPFECAAIIPSTSECKLPRNVKMEDLWVPHQETLRIIVEEHKKLPWFDEIYRQLNDKNTSGAFVRSARDSIGKKGLASSPSEISLIAELARTLG